VRPRRAYGRPGTAVLPERWAFEHGVVADGFASATVNIREAGGTPGDFDETTGTTPTVPFEPFAELVPAAVKPLGADQSMSPGVVVAGDVVKVTGYLLSLPVGFEGLDDPLLGEGALVDVVTCDDPLLEGRTLTVTDAVRGTDRMTRDLIATVND